MYAYFKQATVGPCNIVRPSMLDISGCAKWDAWKALGDLSSSGAKEYYVSMIAELSQVGTSTPRDSENTGGGSGFSMGPAMSRMADTEGETIAEADKDIFIYSAEGNRTAVSCLLEQKVDVNCQDANGLTPLHWAVDRGHKDFAEFLILRKANIDAQDAEQATPLHYAVDCDHAELVLLLLKAGANRTVQNLVGETPEKLVSSPEVRSLFLSS
jgi:hypothetical protein